MKFNYFLTANIFIICSLSTALHGQQDSILDGYNKNLLNVYNQEVISYGAAFIKDGEKLKSKEVRELLLKFPDSAAEFSLFQKKSTMSRVLMISSFILIGAALSERNSDLGYVFVLSGIGVGIPATILGRKSYRHLQNSLWLYNRDILIQ